MQKIIVFGLYMFLVCSANTYADIAFVANVDGNWDLYVADDDGRNVGQLTKTLYDEKSPSWSSDRGNIVYATSDGHLNIVETATGKSNQVAADKQGNAKICPSFSPEGKEIAFCQFRSPEEGDDTDLMIYDLETRKIRRIVDQPSIQMWPTWPPDGRHLIYANAHCSGECGRLIQELWVADPKGGWSRQLLMTNALCQQPDWSPDGKRIAFSSDMSGNFDIWVLRLDDWKLEQLTTDGSLDVSPAWSPDGKKMAFVSTRSGIMEIWIKDLNGGEARRLKPFLKEDVECKDVDW